MRCLVNISNKLHSILIRKIHLQQRIMHIYLEELFTTEAAEHLAIYAAYNRIIREVGLKVINY